MDPMNNLENPLEQIRRILQAHQQLSIDLRGTGNSAFLYIRSSDRSAEISVDRPGFFVEYWEIADEESYEPPVESEVVISLSEAVSKLNAWFTTSLP
jgi:hypothetical protein